MLLKGDVMMKNFLRITFLVSIFLVSGFHSSVASSESCERVEGNINKGSAKVWCKNIPPDVTTRPGHHAGPGNGGGGNVVQPISPVTDEGVVDQKRIGKRSPDLVPCGSADASTERSIAPIGFDGARRDPITGVPYACVAKTPDGQPADPITYPLPDGSTIELPAPIVVTVEDMEELGLLASTPHQERAPHTLKNYHTNFWVNPNPQTFNTEIGGVPVEVRATPVRYTYHYGDGHELSTTTPGYELGPDVWDQETATSHQYQEAQDYEFRATTFYRGEFSVAGGPWQVMEGLGEVTSEPMTVRVWRTEVKGVAEGCGQNAQAWGCPGAKK